MDDKLFMIWFVVSFAFSNQTGPDQATPFWGLGLGRTRTGSFEQFVVLLIETQWREEICSPG